MSRTNYANQPITKARISEEQFRKIDNIPFPELRKMLLTEIIPELMEPIENSENSALLAKTTVTPYDVFEQMFHGPLDNWKIPNETMEAARQKYLPLIELAMEDKTKTPYQRVGEIKDLFVEFRKEMPRRIHIRPGKTGIPYGTQHRVLREAMDCLLEGLSMRELPMHNQAYFPNGNPWSATLSKILDKTPVNSKYDNQPASLSFLFRIGGQNEREFNRKHLKGEILSSLTPIEQIVISPRFGRLHEPRINPWIWHDSANLNNHSSSMPTVFDTVSKINKPGTFKRHDVHTFIDMMENDTNKKINDGRSLTHLQFHLLTSDSTTVNREYIKRTLRSFCGKDLIIDLKDFDFLGTKNTQREPSRAKEIEIDAGLGKELNTLGLEHIKANPWCILDMPAEIPPVWLKTALEKQPLLILFENFTSLHTSWKEKVESIQPGSVDYIKSSITSLCYAMGYDLQKEETRQMFRNEMLRYFKDGALEIKSTSVNLDGLDGIGSTS